MKNIQCKIIMLLFFNIFEIGASRNQSYLTLAPFWQKNIQQQSENVQKKSLYFPKTDSIRPKRSEFIYIYEKNLTIDDYKNAHFIYEDEGMIIAAQIRSTQISHIPCHFYFHLLLYNKGLDILPVNEPLDGLLLNYDGTKFWLEEAPEDKWYNAGGSDLSVTELEHKDSWTGVYMIPEKFDSKLDHVTHLSFYYAKSWSVYYRVYDLDKNENADWE